MRVHMQTRRMRSKSLGKQWVPIYAGIMRSSAIPLCLPMKRKKRKYIHQINFSRAIRECRHFLVCKADDPPDVEAVIMQYMLPIRPGRNSPRRVKIICLFAIRENLNHTTYILFLLSSSVKLNDIIHRMSSTLKIEGEGS